MAFEDRSSPTTGSSPNNEKTSNTLNAPNSPESTRTSSYTCTIIPQPIDTTRSNTTSPLSPIVQQNSTNYLKSLTDNNEPSFFRITKYALSSPIHESQRRFPNREPQKLEETSNAPRTIAPQSNSTINNNSDSSDDSTSNSEDNSIQCLKYSIRNILQPDFGKDALQRTKSDSKISFKPYEMFCKTKSQKIAPLGSLCQTVSQIGKTPTIESPTKAKSSVEKLVEVHNEEESSAGDDGKVPKLWPAWVYCTRYSDRPSSGPRSRRMKKESKPAEEKRPRTAFSGAQLSRLKHEFAENRYLTERRRQQLSQELGLNEAQIKIWFQNKRAKIKKSTGQKNPLALQLMAQGLYNHTTASCDDDEMCISP